MDAYIWEICRYWEALIVSEGLYMAISDKYDTNHETVVHNRRFVNAERIPMWFEKQ